MTSGIQQFASRAIALIVVLFSAAAPAFAQLDIDVDLGKEQWYENPLVWVGAAVFLLILAFIVRGRK